MKALNIYNLYPRLYKNIKEWTQNLDRIIDMGFNSIFINPIHYPGASGSIYAVKDYYKYNKQFFTNEKEPEKQLKDFIIACKEKKLDIFMDLVINHTSIDAYLVKQHRNWYKIDDAGNIENPGAWHNGGWVTWKDLASFNLDDSPDKENLWHYLINLTRHYLKLGFTGFRCDAAYQISRNFWIFLISTLKKEFSNILFLAETLGCTPGHIQSLFKCGFDYIFNSSKWWDFQEEWCLEQYDITREITPSISFPESHDTKRLMKEANGNETLFLQRLYFSGIFSKGFMITAGFEYGLTKRIDSIKTTSEDWKEKSKDYSTNIKKILSIKKSFLPLHEESSMEVIAQPNNVFCFLKEWKEQKILICINKDIKNNQKINFNNLEKLLKTSKIKDYSPEERISGYIQKLNINLLPGEVKIIASEKHYIS